MINKYGKLIQTCITLVASLATGIHAEEKALHFNPSAAAKIQEDTRTKNSTLVQNLHQLTQRFPNLAKRTHEQSFSIQTLAQNTLSHIKNQAHLKLSWGDTLDREQYVPYLLEHLNNLVATKNTTDQIIHTTAGGSGSLPTYLMSNALLKLGFNDISINVINAHISPEEIMQIKKLAHNSLEKNQRFLLQHYQSEEAYMQAVEQRFTKQGSSFQISIPTQKKTSFTNEVAQHNPALYETINELIVTTDNKETITVTFHYDQEPTMTVQGNSPATTKAATVIKETLHAAREPLPTPIHRSSYAIINALRDYNTPIKKVSTSDLAKKIITACEKEDVGLLLVNNHDRSFEEHYQALIAKTTAERTPLVYILNNSSFKKHEALYR